MARFSLWIIGCASLLGGAVAPLTAGEVDFTRHVRPILSGRCFKCHGPDADKREAGLRLDLGDAAVKELESGERAIVPGNPGESGLIARVTSQDEFVRMPPPSEGPPLTEKEIAVLRDWIAQGAKYEAHWSFVPVTRPVPPAVNNAAWCRNPIDRFVLARLETKGLAPSPEADRYALIRRVFLDVIGLPPSVEEVDAFVADPSPDAYEAMVDRLLASPAFGERWGRIWLDLARYADSAGYADDPPRSIWRYRDWVIRALNSNMPFDQFTVEQLAGDLLPNPTDDQLIATAFHRNTMTNSEGGTDDEEFRNAAVVDRVNTTMQVWMGLTMGCAQCHTHKYDPITQTEYYRTFAIFNQTEDADRRDEAPNLEAFTPLQELQRVKLLERIDAAERELAAAKARASETSDISIPDAPSPVRFVRIELPGKEKFLSLAEVQVFQGDRNLALGGTATQSSTDYDGAAERAIDGNTDGHYFNANSTTHTKLSDDPWWEVDLGSPATVDRVVLWNRSDSPGIGKRLDGFRIVLLNDQRRPIWVHVVDQAPEKEAEFKIPAGAGEYSDADRDALLAYGGLSSPEVEKINQRIDALKKELAAIKPVPTPIMRELPDEKRRTTRIQIRGNFLDLGEEVRPGIPAAFALAASSVPDTRSVRETSVGVKDRLELARWLVDPQNPLTGRVVANRHWEALFGIGLVETSEDFGMQGALPSHPELLDWLAAELVDSGWDLKHLIRLIVTSATYRQNSSAEGELAETDPQNRLLARGPRFRLSAEKVRDQALAIGGLLSRKMYGEPVHPPRPKLGLTAAFGKSTDWETSPGEDKYRRGIYTFWQRTMPYPSMDAFDAPSREVCTVRRIRTNTPLQALVTLNDPVYVEAAQGLAGRMLGEGGETVRDRLQYGFRLCCSRPATDSELAVLVNLFEQAQKRFAADRASAQRLQAISQSDLSEIPAGEQAAWTVVGNVLLNLDETLARR